MRNPAVALDQEKHQVPLLLGQGARNMWGYYQEMLDAEATSVESNHFFHKNFLQKLLRMHKISKGLWFVRNCTIRGGTIINNTVETYLSK